MGENYEIISEIIDYSNDKYDGRILVQVDCPMPDGSSKRAFVNITSFLAEKMEEAFNDGQEYAELLSPRDGSYSTGDEYDELDPEDKARVDELKSKYKQ